MNLLPDGSNATESCDEDHYIFLPIHLAILVLRVNYTWTNLTTIYDLLWCLESERKDMCLGLSFYSSLQSIWPICCKWLLLNFLHVNTYYILPSFLEIIFCNSIVNWYYKEQFTMFSKVERTARPVILSHASSEIHTGAGLGGCFVRSRTVAPFRKKFHSSCAISPDNSRIFERIWIHNGVFRGIL